MARRIGTGAPGRAATTATPWALAAAGLAAVLAYFVVWGHRYGLDLRVYRAGIAAWEAGRDPYLSVYTPYRLAFTYPPGALPLLSPLGLGPLAVAQVAQWAVGLGALGVSVHLAGAWARAHPDRCRQRGPCRLVGASAAGAATWACLAALAMEPARSALDYGQVDAVLMAVVVVDLLLVPSRHRGWLVGLAASVKLTPLLFAGLFLLERDWRSLGRAVGTFLGVSVVMLAAWPATTLRYWRHAAWDVGRIGSVAFGGNQSWYGLLSRIPVDGLPREVLWLLLSGLTAVACAGLAAVHLREGRRLLAVFAVALGVLLVSPVAWTHEWIWAVLVVPVVWTLGTGRDTRPLRTALWILLALLVVAPFSWSSGGTVGEVLDGAVPVWTAVVLATWLVLTRPAPARLARMAGATTPWA